MNVKKSQQESKPSPLYPGWMETCHQQNDQNAHVLSTVRLVKSQVKAN